MEPSKKTILFAAGLCSALACAAMALETDNTTQTKPVYLMDEFRAAVADVEDPAKNAEKKHDAYTQLARLLFLSGDIENAAAAWENAAHANPEKRDDAALAESAVCYVSIGDWDKADGIVKLLLLTSRDDKNISARAAYLHGQIEALHNGNTEALDAIADNPDYVSFRPAIYYTLWQASGDNGYRTKLLTEFPDSPEAYSAADGVKGSGHVAALETAHWLLFPGREEFRGITQKEVQPDGKSASPNLSAKHTGAVAASAKTSRSLQTGLYREKENAALQAARLEADGFNAALTPRTVDGTSFWAVSVSIPEGATMKNTIERLKEHGFDAFPTATRIN
jgi:tetratricopeptide (TPR) repeat protein